MDDRNPLFDPNFESEKYWYPERVDRLLNSFFDGANIRTLIEVSKIQCKDPKDAIGRKIWGISKAYSESGEPRLYFPTEGRKDRSGEPFVLRDMWIIHYALMDDSHGKSTDHISAVLSREPKGLERAFEKLASLSFVGLNVGPKKDRDQLVRDFADRQVKDKDVFGSDGMRICWR